MIKINKTYRGVIHNKRSERHENVNTWIAFTDLERGTQINKKINKFQNNKHFGTMKYGSRNIQCSEFSRNQIH